MSGRSTSLTSMATMAVVGAVGLAAVLAAAAGLSLYRLIELTTHLPSDQFLEIDLFVRRTATFGTVAVALLSLVLAVALATLRGAVLSPLLTAARAVAQEAGSSVSEAPAGKFREIDEVHHAIALLRELFTRSKIHAEALRAGEKYLREIIELSPTGIVVSDPEDGCILLANSRFADLIGQPGRIVGRYTRQYYADPGDRQRLLERLDREGTVRDAELKLRRADNRTLCALATLDRFEFDGRPALLTWFYDITKRRQAEEQLRKLSLAVECSPATVIITDARGVVEYVNSRFIDTTGYSPAEAIGQTPALWKSGSTPPEVYRDLWTTLVSGRRWSGEILNRKKSGQLYWEAAAIAPIADAAGAITHFVAVKEDITERKATQEALREAKERAEEAARAKSEFLAVMSHEIRTPLTGILGMVKLLLGTRLDAMQRDYVETVQYSGEALLGILNDVLDLSKIEAGRLELEEVGFELPRLLDSTLLLMSSRAKEKKLQLDSHIAPEVPRLLRGDPTRLRQVLLNLVSNAIKFTERGSVGVAVDMVGEGEDITLRFSVTDTGIGIAKEAQAALFQEYSQADASIARRFGGSGLGLAICRKIVALMGGRIGVESTAGEGSTFRFEAPFRKGHAEPDPPASGPAPAKALRPLHVLVAEDNPVNRRVASAFIDRLGHKVTAVEDGVAAIEALLVGDFDMILMDMEMPRLGGLEATARIRALDGAKARIPIIAFTANALAGDDERCLAAGMNGYIAKPIDPDKLERALNLAAPQGVAASSATPADPAPATVRRMELFDPAPLHALVEILGETAVAGLLTDYFAFTRDKVDAIGGCARSGDGEGMRVHAHDLKSSSGNFGFKGMVSLAEAVELACRAGHADEASRLALLLPQRLEATLARLRQAPPELIPPALAAV